MMKVDEMTNQERRVYDVLMTNETKLSDGYMYYVPFHFVIDGYWVDAEQDAVFLGLIKLIIRAVEGAEWVDQASGKTMTKKQTFYLNKAIEAGLVNDG